MTPEQIQKMAEGCPPSSIGKDHEEVVTWLAEKHIALQEQVQKLAALAEERRVFIVNGVEMGYIQLPVFDDDSATSTYQRCLLKPKFAADAVIREIGAKAGKFCDKAPAGYHCTRLAWHDGPCAAVDTNREGQP